MQPHDEAVDLLILQLCKQLRSGKFQQLVQITAVSGDSVGASLPLMGQLFEKVANRKATRPIRV